MTDETPIPHIFKLYNTTTIPQDILFKNNSLLKRFQTIRVIHTNTNLEFKTAVGNHEFNGATYPIPSSSSIGVISELNLVQTEAGARGFSCPNQGCGVAVYVSEDERINASKIKLTLQLRIVHELLHHFQKDADGMDAWILRKENLSAVIAGLLSRFGFIDWAQYLYYSCLISELPSLEVPDE